MLKILICILVIWETIYTISFGLAQKKEKNRGGEIVIFSLLGVKILLFLNFLTDFVQF